MCYDFVVVVVFVVVIAQEGSVAVCRSVGWADRMGWNGTAVAVVVVVVVPRFAALPLCPLYEMKARHGAARS